MDTTFSVHPVSTTEDHRQANSFNYNYLSSSKNIKVEDNFQDLDFTLNSPSVPSSLAPSFVNQVSDISNPESYSSNSSLHPSSNSSFTDVNSGSSYNMYNSYLVNPESSNGNHYANVTSLHNSSSNSASHHHPNNVSTSSFWAPSHIYNHPEMSINSYNPQYTPSNGQYMYNITPQPPMMPSTMPTPVSSTSHNSPTHSHASQLTPQSTPYVTSHLPSSNVSVSLTPNSHPSQLYSHAPVSSHMHNHHFPHHHLHYRSSSEEPELKAEETPAPVATRRSTRMSKASMKNSESIYAVGAATPVTDMPIRSVRTKKTEEEFYSGPTTRKPNTPVSYTSTPDPSDSEEELVRYNSRRKLGNIALPTRPKPSVAPDGRVRNSSLLHEANKAAAVTAANDSEIDEFLASKNGQRLSKKDRNKLSAMKYRKKRKLFLVELEDKVESLEEDNRALVDENNRLMQENNKMLLLLAHNNINISGLIPSQTVEQEPIHTNKRSKRNAPSPESDQYLYSPSSAGQPDSAGTSPTNSPLVAPNASGGAYLFMFFSFLLLCIPFFSDLSSWSSPSSVSSFAPSSEAMNRHIMENINVLTRQYDSYINSKYFTEDDIQLHNKGRVLLQHLKSEVMHEMQVDEAEDGYLEVYTPLTTVDSRLKNVVYTANDTENSVEDHDSTDSTDYFAYNQVEGKKLKKPLKNPLNTDNIYVHREDSRVSSLSFSSLLRTVKKTLFSLYSNLNIVLWHFLFTCMLLTYGEWSGLGRFIRSHFSTNSSHTFTPSKTTPPTSLDVEEKWTKIKDGHNVVYKSNARRIVYMHMEEDEEYDFSSLTSDYDSDEDLFEEDITDSDVDFSNNDSEDISDDEYQDSGHIEQFTPCVENVEAY